MDPPQHVSLNDDAEGTPGEVHAGRDGRALSVVPNTARRGTCRSGSVRCYGFIWTKLGLPVFQQLPPGGGRGRAVLPWELTDQPSLLHPVLGVRCVPSNSTVTLDVTAQTLPTPSQTSPSHCTALASPGRPFSSFSAFLGGLSRGPRPGEAPPELCRYHACPPLANAPRTWLEPCVCLMSVSRLHGASCETGPVGLSATDAVDSPCVASGTGDKSRRGHSPVLWKHCWRLAPGEASPESRLCGVGAGCGEGAGKVPTRRKCSTGSP